MQHSKIKYLLKNGLKGLIWLAIILAAYFIFNHLFPTKDPDNFLVKLTANPLKIYSIYFVSEFFFGIIPPEFFMIWSINRGGDLYYFIHLLFFAITSYGLGYVTFQIGRLIHKLVIFRYIRIKLLKKVWAHLQHYGIFLIIVAALTPVPWSATCMLVGSTAYPTSRFLKYALFRIVRFGLYGYIVYQTHQF